MFVCEDCLKGWTSKLAAEDCCDPMWERGTE
jgi:hypothetical protein